MTYTVIKTINGNGYYYEQESYRENGKVKTRCKYIGPVKPKRGVLSLIGEAAEGVRQAAMIKHIWQIDPTPEQLAIMERDRAAQEHINDLLDPSHHITLAELQEVIDYQHREIAPPLPMYAAADFAPGEECRELHQGLPDASSDDVSPTPSEPPPDAVPETETATPSEQSPSDAPETASPE